MFENIEFKNWKKSFNFETTKEDILKVKYSHKWYFPIMFLMLSILLFSFAIFTILFFAIDKELLIESLSYIIMVFLYIIFWIILFVIIQKRAIYPHSLKSKGHLIFKETYISIEKKNETKKYEYNKIKKIYFNKKTCALVLLDNNNNKIFTEILKNEDVYSVLNLLYKMTKIKPIFL